MSRPLDPQDVCPATWPDHDLHGAPCTAETCSGHEHCETPVAQHGDDDHHDIVDHSGPWLRWCDYPLTCDRLDCDLSAASASKDARMRRMS